MDNSWGNKIQRVYAGGKRYDTVEELKKAVIAVWVCFEIDELQKLFVSYKAKLFFLVEQRRHPIRLEF